MERLILALVLSFIPSDGFGGSNKTYHHYPIHKLHSDDRSCFYAVEIAYDIVATTSFDFTQYEVPSFTLIVAKHAPGYQNAKRLFLNKFPGFKTKLLSTLPPTHSKNYVPGVAMPTGRLLLADGQVYLILFDGSNCSLNRLVNDKEGFIRVTTPNKAEMALLRQLYKDAFSLDDVYWCYCLVRNAGFFGYTYDIRRLTNEFIDTEFLFREWKRIKG